jgi:hypothetical protein
VLLGGAAPAGLTAGVAAAAILLESSPLPRDHLPLDINFIAAAQAGCPYCKQALQSSVLKEVQVSMEEQPVLIDVSSGVMWLYKSTRDSF